jgi:hypothetical protein
MLGLGNSITNSAGTFGKPAISALTGHFSYLMVSTQGADGAIAGTAASTTVFDVRIYGSVANVDLPASNYTITSAVVTNETTSQSDELITTPLVCDSTANLAGAIFFLFDDSSVLDDADFGSNSGKNAAHNGTGNNTYSVVIKFTHEEYEGEQTISVAASLPLTDSDA